MGMTSGLRVVVDVQHLYREKPDRGSVFTLANGLTTTEAGAALIYGAAITAHLLELGAQVMTNDASRGILVGPYSRRNAVAAGWGANAYLACHVNAGGGSYAAVEYMSTTVGAALASSLANKIRECFPLDLTGGRTVPLSSSSRGAVCIERNASSCAAVICEPFFGDNPRHQHLLSAPRLVTLGEAIAEGVVGWWKARQVTIV